MDSSNAKAGKFKPLGEGPYKVLENNGRTVVINRDGLVERVSASHVTNAPPSPQGDVTSRLREFVAEPATWLPKTVKVQHTSSKMCSTTARWEENWNSKSGGGGTPTQLGNLAPTFLRN